MKKKEREREREREREKERESICSEDEVNSNLIGARGRMGVRLPTLFSVSYSAIPRLRIYY